MSGARSVGEQCDATIPGACAPPTSLTEQGVNRWGRRRGTLGRKGRSGARQSAERCPIPLPPHNIGLQPPRWRHEEWCSPIVDGVQRILPGHGTCVHTEEVDPPLVAALNTEFMHHAQNYKPPLLFYLYTVHLENALHQKLSKTWLQFLLPQHIKIKPARWWKKKMIKYHRCTIHYPLVLQFLHVYIHHCTTTSHSTYKKSRFLRYLGAGVIILSSINLPIKTFARQYIGSIRISPEPWSIW